MPSSRYGCRLPVRPRQARGRRAHAGITLLEVLIACAIAALAMAGHLAATGSEHKHSQAQALRATGVELAEQFIQRLRGDEDWPTLYARLRVLQDESGLPPAQTVTLDDGRRAYLPQAYLPDFTADPIAVHCRVRVEVPAAPLVEDPTGPSHLREDLLLPRFGLPADLNRDGVVDGGARDGDYLFLPIRVRWHLVRPGESPQDLVISAWLRGQR